MSKYQKIASLEKTNTSLIEEINQLKGQLSLLQKLVFGPKFEKSKVIAIDQNQLSIFAEEQQDEITSQSTEITVPTHTRKKKKPVRSALPDSLERVEEIIEPEHDLEGWHKVSENVTEVLECEPARLYVRRIIRSRYVKELENGDSIFSQSDLPTNLPFPKSIASASLVAQMIISKFVGHIPVYRFIKQFERQNVYLKNTTLIDLQKKVSGKLTPLYEVLLQKIRRSNYRHIDESPIKVM